MKKSVYVLILTFLVSVMCFAATACGRGSSGDNANGNDSNKPEFASGTGTETDPYVIDSAYQWLNVANYPDSYFELSADINLGDYQKISPVGTSELPFTGTIDGKNHKISGAAVRSASNAGLFGIASGATIKNLGFTNSSVYLESKNDDDVLSSFVAIARKGTVIENCYSEKVNINFAKYSIKYVMIGGFAGHIESVSSITCCHSNVNIKAPDGSRFRIGGFARYISGSTIDCCYTTGSISVWGPSGVKVCRIGTFVDTMINSDISNMYAEMSVNAKGATGVYYFAGYVDEESLEFCLNFCDYQSTPDGKYETCKVNYSGSEAINIYFPSSQYAFANDTLDKSLWQDNLFWKKGTIHPELVSYQEYLEIKAGE